MKKTAKQYEVLKWASLFLEEHHCEVKIAEILLQHFLKVPRSTFYMNMREEVPDDVVHDFRKAIHEHVRTGVPVQHLTGYAEFYGREFKVNEHTLIPRPETEELVLKVIEHASEVKAPIIVDVGTGSGVIAITLALEVPGATIIATDISASALSVAKKNAKKHGARIQFIQGDYLKPLLLEQMKVDVIVSNPPYISYEDKSTLTRTVKDFDPELALFARDNGLAAYQTLMMQMEHVLDDDGTFFFEIGYRQANEIMDLCKEKFPNGNASVYQDINQNDRIISGKIK